MQESSPETGKPVTIPFSGPCTTVNGRIRPYAEVGLRRGTAHPDRGAHRAPHAAPNEQGRKDVFRVPGGHMG